MKVRATTNQAGRSGRDTWPVVWGGLLLVGVCSSCMALFSIRGEGTSYSTSPLHEVWLASNNGEGGDRQTSIEKDDSRPWASLSSDYPPPRKPAGPATLDENLLALQKWRHGPLVNLKTMSRFCRADNEALRDECLARNERAAAETARLEPNGLTREARGYNLKNFVMVIGGDTLLPIEKISAGYEKLFENLKLHSAVNYMGISFQQDPADALAIGDLLWRVQPDLLIELGTSGGGSAFYYSHIMQRYNPNAKILTMDPASGTWDGVPLRQWNDVFVRKHCPFCEHATTAPEWNSQDGPIRFYRGLPDSAEALEIAHEAASQAKTVLVMEDSNHEYDSVNRNLDAYHSLVTPGSYFIVQDTRLGGPHRAIRKFLRSPKGDCFDIDKRWEYMIFSQHFDGFLRKRPDCPSTS